MKRTLIAAAALALASVAWAQDSQEKKPQAEPEKKPQAEQPEKMQPATVARKSRRMEDARHCLQRATNTEIIKCAEEYL